MIDVRTGKFFDSSGANSFALEFCEDRLQLRYLEKPGLGAICVDFCSGANRHRRLFGGGRRQALLKAVGRKKGSTPSVVDATAGLGRDAFVLASYGCRVHMIERSPAVAALLEDGLRRAALDPQIGPWVKERMSMVQDDSCRALYALPFEPDCIYMDPMFPKRKKAAQVKKEMYIFQALIKDEAGIDELFKISLTIARQRVIVKRPVKAPWLNQKRPDTAIKQVKHRFDIYLTKLGQ